MAVPAKDRQAAYQNRLRAGVAPVIKVIEARPPVTRKARLGAIVGDLTSLRNEYQRWLDSRPENYSDISDANAERLAEVESFLEQVAEVLDSLADIEVPRIRID